MQNDDPESEGTLKTKSKGMDQIVKEREKKTQQNKTDNYMGNDNSKKDA